MKRLLEKQNNQLRQIIDHSCHLSKLIKLIYQELPPEIAAYCKVANIRDGQLILLTANASWATHLRYRVPMLLDAIHNNDQLKQVQKIKILVDKTLFEKQEKNFSSVKTFSRATIEHIKMIATLLHSDKLKQSLKKLAEQLPVKK